MTDNEFQNNDVQNMLNMISKYIQLFHITGLLNPIFYKGQEISE